MTSVIQGRCGGRVPESRAAEVSQPNGVWQGLSTSFHAPDTQLPPYSAVEPGASKWQRAPGSSLTRLAGPVLSAAACWLWRWAGCVKETPVRTELTPWACSDHEQCIYFSVVYVRKLLFNSINAELTGFGRYRMVDGSRWSSFLII